MLVPIDFFLKKTLTVNHDFLLVSLSGNLLLYPGHYG